MKVEDYITLNSLLTQHKIDCFKVYANTDLLSKKREKAFMQVRYINYVLKGLDDALKNNMEEIKKWIENNQEN